MEERDVWHAIRQAAYMPSVRLNPQVLLAAYGQGVFPMADRDGSIRWYSADPRGILPLADFHIPRTLQATLRAGRFVTRVNTAFEQTMRACMSNRPDGSWINDALIDAYLGLHRLGFAHSVESWVGEQLVGGLYGVSLGGAFFGESMFHRVPDASKVALVRLVQRLVERRFQLLDTQATTPHLRRFGCIEIPAEQYLRLLGDALPLKCRFA